MLELQDIVDDFTYALVQLDAKRPVCKSFLPGIGPFGEKEGVQMAFDEMRSSRPGPYDNAAPRKLAGCNSATDIVIGDEWALEFKVARPYGNNGALAEHWIINLLYPYPGNYSSLGDGMKLTESEFDGRKALIVFGFEHQVPETELETAIRSFELIATEVIGLKISNRIGRSAAGLVHPVHANLVVAAWEIDP